MTDAQWKVKCEQIAAEKAGIIKPEIPVVIGETQEGSKDVFIKTAKEKNSPIFFADKIMDCRKDSTYSLDYQQFDIYKNNESYLKELKYPLLGNYQKKNLATVICALDILRDSFKIEERHIIDGLANVIKNTSLMGRWQVINKNPLAIADTGHNVAGINEVNRQLAETKYNKLHFVLSVVNDKDKFAAGFIPDQLRKQLFFFWFKFHFVVRAMYLATF